MPSPTQSGEMSPISVCYAAPRRPADCHGRTGGIVPPGLAAPPDYVTQHATDILLNEIERRGELTFLDNDVPIVPYMSDYTVETILTRQGRD
jgi:hypothetical protein